MGGMELLAIAAVLGVLALPILVVAILCRLNRVLRRIDDLERMIHAKPSVPPPAAAQAKPSTATTPEDAAAPHAACPQPASRPQPVVERPRLEPDRTPPPPLPPPALPPRRPEPPPAAPPSADTLALRLLRKAWNWLIVGEEFRRADVSAESAIATVWLIRAGILLVVCAAGFGLQLSIKHGLLGPEGRVALTILGGGAFLALGSRLIGRERYALMGQGLLGGGLALLYFACFSAHVMFQLIPVLPSFGLMTLVTGAAVVLALRHQSLSTAVLGAVGGFATPVMLQTDAPNLAVLLAYLIILGTGMAAIALHRQWPLLVWLSLLFSTSIVAGTLGTSSWDTADWPIALGGVALLFALYSTAIFGYAVRHRVEATPIEAGGLFINAAFLLGQGWIIFDAIGRTRAGLALLTLALALFYLAHLAVFLARRMHDHTLLTVFAAITGAALALTLPCLFSDEALSASWAILATALLWTGCRLLSRLVFNGALLLYLIAALRAAGAFFDSLSRFTAQAQPAAYLPGLIDRLTAQGIPILALFAALAILRRRPAPSALLPQDLPPLPLLPGLPVLTTTLAITGAWAYLTLEASLCLTAFLPTFTRVAVTAVWTAFLWHLFTLKTRTRNGTLAALCLVGLALLAGKWLLFDLLGGDPLASGTWHYLSGMGVEHWLPRLLNLLVLLAGIGAMRRLTAPPEDEPQGLPLRPLITFISIGAGLLYLTFETATLFHAFVPAFEAGAVSLAWGLYALGLLGAGLRIDLRPLRLAGLALFAASGVKVVFSDLAGLDIVWRLLAFGLLGGAMLAAAFAYLRARQPRR